MNLHEYSKLVQSTAVYPRETITEALTYTTLGLTGESGEVANQVKKIIRDDAGVLTYVREEKIIDEVGDCFWYLVALCRELQISPTLVLQRNANKLIQRQEQNTIHGDARNV